MRKPATQWARARLAIQRVCRDERGVTAIEYALLASLIMLVILGAVTLVGTSASALYAAIGAAIGAL